MRKMPAVNGPKCSKFSSVVINLGRYKALKKERKKA